ncbi:hypothetical protein FO519_002352 [Halicephalobus sp. NKZ332]|nr:hypothetical protein FO519_002352 [Halicephalobus sp. NKZ332]
MRSPKAVRRPKTNYVVLSRINAQGKRLAAYRNSIRNWINSTTTNDPRYSTKKASVVYHDLKQVEEEIARKNVQQVNTENDDKRRVEAAQKEVRLFLLLSATEEAKQQAEEKRRREEAEAREAEERRKKEEEKQKKLAEEKTKKEAEQKAKKEAEEKSKKEAEEKAKKESEEKAKKEAEEKAKKEAEEKAKKEAEEKAKKETEEKAKKEAEQKAKEAEKKAKKEAEQKAKEAEKKAKKEAEQKAKKEAEEKKQHEIEAEKKRQEEAQKASVEEVIEKTEIHSQQSSKQNGHKDNQHSKQSKKQQKKNKRNANSISEDKQSNEQNGKEFSQELLLDMSSVGSVQDAPTKCSVDSGVDVTDFQTGKNGKKGNKSTFDASLSSNKSSSDESISEQRILETQTESTPSKPVGEQLIERVALNGTAAIPFDKEGTPTKFAQSVAEFVTHAHQVIQQKAESQPLKYVKIEPIVPLVLPSKVERPRPRERVYKLLPQDIEYCSYMMETYGEDYEAMVKDKKNLFQDSPTHLKRKIRIFRDSPQYELYLKAKAEGKPIKIIQSAVLRSYSANGEFNIYLTPPTAHTKTKIEVKSIRPYNDTRLYSVYKLPDESIIVPVVTVSDMDEAARENNTMCQKYEFTLNYGGRGMELSDLKSFDGHLLSPDDKTGVVYKLTNNKAVPWIINSDGDGEQSASYKGEWMTIKGDELYLGGYGKEYTDQKGRFMNNNPMWIKVISRFGEIRSENWEDRYKRLRSSIGIEFPAYIIHESCQWSEIHKKWFFLPRRVSLEPYNDVTDQMKGSNYLITADEQFTKFDHVRIGQVHLSRGFSSFQFLPETNDTLIIALKTEEVDRFPIATYSMIFRIDGTILVDETKLLGNYKFEGIEFANWNT